MIDRFLDALDTGRAYDFIANHYTTMSKYDLKTILLEYIYASKDIGEVTDSVREELEVLEIPF